VNIPEETRAVMRLFGSGPRPGPLMTMLMRECEVPRHKGNSPATRRAEQRRHSPRTDGTEFAHRRIGDQHGAEFIAENRRRWEERIAELEAQRLAELDVDGIEEAFGLEADVS
jgi:hypothetical protein